MTAFQPGAFQHDAFQIYGGSDGVPDADFPALGRPVSRRPGLRACLHDFGGIAIIAIAGVTAPPADGFNTAQPRWQGHQYQALFAPVISEAAAGSTTIGEWIQTPQARSRPGLKAAQQEFGGVYIPPPVTAGEFVPPLDQPRPVRPGLRVAAQDFGGYTPAPIVGQPNTTGEWHRELDQPRPKRPGLAAAQQQWALETVTLAAAVVPPPGSMFDGLAGAQFRQVGHQYQALFQPVITVAAEPGAPGYAPEGIWPTQPAKVDHWPAIEASGVSTGGDWSEPLPFPPFDQPAPKRPGLKAAQHDFGGISFTFIVVPPATVGEWYQFLDQPRPRRPGLVAAQQQWALGTVTLADIVPEPVVTVPPLLGKQGGWPGGAEAWKRRGKLYEDREEKRKEALEQILAKLVPQAYTAIRKEQTAEAGEIRDIIAPFTARPGLPGASQIKWAALLANNLRDITETLSQALETVEKTQAQSLARQLQEAMAEYQRLEEEHQRLEKEERERDDEEAFLMILRLTS